MKAFVIFKKIFPNPLRRRSPAARRATRGRRRLAGRARRCERVRSGRGRSSADSARTQEPQPVFGHQVAVSVCTRSFALQSLDSAELAHTY
eukprot:70157-Pleurochrysis_carterae.AAC.4